MDNRDLKNVIGEWLCTLMPSPIVKSAIHADLSSMYHQDFIIISNLCNGYGYVPKISITIIDGATEWYKQTNKAFLESSNLSRSRKAIISSGIDNNAETERQRWISILQYKGINITD